MLKLNKALYGLKQSLREWNMALEKFLREDLKMTHLKTEQCIYVRIDEDRSEYIILAVYVDDLVIVGELLIEFLILWFLAQKRVVYSYHNRYTFKMC